MTIEFHDAGLRNVWLQNGYAIRRSAEGEFIRYVDLGGLLDALALALIRKPARLDSGEFRWLRRHIGASQQSLAEIVGRDVQTISLIERGKQPPVLVDRELRRLAAETLVCSELDDHSEVSVMVGRTRYPGTVQFFGRYSERKWTFDTVRTMQATDELAGVHLAGLISVDSVLYNIGFPSGSHRIVVVNQPPAQTIRTLPQIDSGPAVPKPRSLVASVRGSTCTPFSGCEYVAH